MSTPEVLAVYARNRQLRELLAAEQVEKERWKHRAISRRAALTRTKKDLRKITQQIERIENERNDSNTGSGRRTVFIH